MPLFESDLFFLQRTTKIIEDMATTVTTTTMIPIDARLTLESSFFVEYYIRIIRIEIQKMDRLR